MDVEGELKAVAQIMDEIIDDTTVPRNVRRAVSEAKEKILSGGQKDVNISTAIYLLDEVSNDINLPAHARTEIWNIISELERIKEKIKV